VKPVSFCAIALLCCTASPLALAQTTGDQPEREEIVVIGTTPLPGSNLDIRKVPGAVQTLSADDFAANHSMSILDTLSQRVPGLQLSDSEGNGGFEDVHYRGFAASPLQGTPQGIAIYQNGVRLNEAFGDTVNWDMIPETAIERLSLTSNNPAFGLNAIGGALNLVMKNGFTAPGFEAEIEGGSYGHVNGSIEYGVKSGNLGFYVAGEAFTDGSYRLYSHSDIERIYADAGYDGDVSEFHLIGSAGRSNLGVVGTTPLDLTKQSISAVYTSPQTTKNEVAMLALNGAVNLSDSFAVQTNIYGRHLQQYHVDGNSSDFAACDPTSSYPGQICLANDGFGNGSSRNFLDQFVIMDHGGQTFRFVPDAPYGTLDRTSTNTTTFGAALQITADAPLFDHGNKFVVGASLDHSDIRFASNSTLAYINPQLQVGLNADLPGSGAIIHTLGNVGYQPVGLDATTDYYGIYLADTFDITAALSAR
jgi:iron complex outermembrane receptor protein